ncbi:MAG: hypothetical protein EAZ44_03440 [Cytophagia bacterium]|nr:MAG: hypothetical protein EAZ44_03440 [Cytophagia bacterium]TAG43931.1 MAG: hypothetical protein EAZ31_03265 [Cytophagia bacterium]TAH29932.1 MAG: hypothetical protein EAZ06_05075 [Cytophagales bacterium]
MNKSIKFISLQQNYWLLLQKLINLSFLFYKNKSKIIFIFFCVMRSDYSTLFFNSKLQKKWK